MTAKPSELMRTLSNIGAIMLGDNKVIFGGRVGRSSVAATQVERRMASTDGFFGQPTPQSALKAEIVSKYIWAWARLLYKDARDRAVPLRYLDLFAGTGCYDDGTPSTPLLVLGKAIADDNYRDLVAANLFEKDHSNFRQLRAAVESLPGVASLRYPPRFENCEVDETTTARFKDELPFPPTFSFVDPWGYKGLSLDLIRALTRHWGCDCVFFFNFNRINAGLGNPLVVEEMDALFGKDRAANLRGRIRGMPPPERERVILQEIRNAIEEGSQRRTFSFAFKFDAVNRTSHHLILVTKRGVGIEIMKNVLVGQLSWP